MQVTESESAPHETRARSWLVPNRCQGMDCWPGDARGGSDRRSPEPPEPGLLAWVRGRMWVYLAGEAVEDYDIDPCDFIWIEWQNGRET